MEFFEKYMPFIIFCTCWGIFIFFILYGAISDFYKKYIIPLINKKLKSRMYLANNFLRPVKYTKSSQKKDNILQFKRLVFANKYCMVKLMILYDEFYYYNKISNKLFTTKLSNLDTEGIINTLCQKFNFSTTFEDIISIIKYYCSDIENISVELFNEEKEKHTQMNINDMSIAELIELPGINMGKANKIMKYLKNKQFKSLLAFLNYAQISKEDEEEIIKIFNGKTICMLKM